MLKKEFEAGGVLQQLLLHFAQRCCFRLNSAPWIIGALWNSNYAGSC